MLPFQHRREFTRALSHAVRLLLEPHLAQIAGRYLDEYFLVRIHPDGVWAEALSHFECQTHEPEVLPLYAFGDAQPRTFVRRGVTRHEGTLQAQDPRPLYFWTWNALAQGNPHLDPEALQQELSQAVAERDSWRQAIVGAEPLMDVYVYAAQRLCVHVEELHFEEPWYQAGRIQPQAILTFQAQAVQAITRLPAPRRIPRTAEELAAWLTENFRIVAVNPPPEREPRHYVLPHVQIGAIHQEQIEIQTWGNQIVGQPRHLAEEALVQAMWHYMDREFQPGTDRLLLLRQPPTLQTTTHAATGEEQHRLTLRAGLGAPTEGTPRNRV